MTVQEALTACESRRRQRENDQRGATVAMPLSCVPPEDSRRRTSCDVPSAQHATRYAIEPLPGSAARDSTLRDSMPARALASRSS
jgi:hypothetical protein